MKAQPALRYVYGMKRGRCEFCNTTHPDFIPASQYGPGNWDSMSASAKDVRSAERDPEPWVRAWERAAQNHHWAFATLDMVDEQYSAADKAGRAAIAPLRDVARLAYCKSIRSLWLLPHPSQFNHKGTDKHTRAWRNRQRRNAPLTLGLVV